MGGMEATGAYDERPNGGHLHPIALKGNKIYNTFAGALAVGYDFNKKGEFNL